MPIVLYDLAGANPALRFSPYCWRTRLAIAHKDLPVKTIAWRFSDAAKIGFSGQGKVPVIRDGDHVVSDSWTIAEYLEEAYSEHPTLFGGPTGQRHARFVNAWADSTLNPAISRMIVLDVWRVIDPRDQEYFRKSREARFGMTLEEVCRDRGKRIAEFRRTTLQPVRLVLEAQQWLGGDSPSYADYIVFSGFQWARCVSDFELLAEDDPIGAWRLRMLEMFGGLAGSAPIAAAA